MKKINIIMHYPNDSEAIKMLQGVTNNMYIKSIEKILIKSQISVEDKKSIINTLLNDYQLINSIET